LSKLDNAEIAHLLHELREPVGAFVIYLALLDDEEVGKEARKHLDSMRTNVQRMVGAIADIASGFGLEGDGNSAPVRVTGHDRRPHGV